MDGCVYDKGQKDVKSLYLSPTLSYLYIAHRTILCKFLAYLVFLHPKSNI